MHAKLGRDSRALVETLHSAIIIFRKIYKLNKRMKIIFFVVCLLLAQVLKANETKNSNDQESDVILKVIEGLSHLKSMKCKSDLNYTISAYRDRKPWAIASKNEFLLFSFLLSILRSRCATKIE